MLDLRGHRPPRPLRPNIFQHWAQFSILLVRNTTNKYTIVQLARPIYICVNKVRDVLIKDIIQIMLFYLLSRYET